MPFNYRKWNRLSLSFTASFFTLSQFHKRFNLFIIRSTASLIGTEGGDSCGNSMSLETPECEAHGGSSHARGKRPPAVEINSFSSYPKDTDLRTNIYFAPERPLGYSTGKSCTLTESVVYFRSGWVHQPSFQVTSQFTSTTKIKCTNPFRWD